MGEASPSFQLYPRDLLADTDNLTDAAFGLYVRLLCKQWLHGSLPAAFESEDSESMNDLLPIGDVRERRRSWRLIAKHFKPHPTEDGRVAQARLERVREQQKANKARRVEAGSKGASTRWQSHGNRIANASDSYYSGIANASDSDSSGIAKNSLASASASAITDTSVSAAPSAPRSSRPRKPVDPETWTTPLREGVKAMKDTQLRHLDADQQYVLARYHAFRFAGCTLSEPKNRSAAMKIRTSIQNLTERIERSPAKADLTVNEYVALALRLHERAKARIFNAMDVLPEIEIEAAG